ncbi:MAG: monooxygenase [Betaproteobacteria bacterium]|nr:monooxygenase [Betaproteobacteria bacterium]
MHTVMWTFQVPAGTSKDSLRQTIKATAHTYQGIPGLIRKYYGISDDGKTLVGIYLWESRAAAEGLYTAEWVALVTKRWGAPPLRQEWETPMVVEAAERRLVEAA